MSKDKLHFIHKRNRTQRMWSERRAYQRQANFIGENRQRSFRYVKSFFHLVYSFEGGLLRDFSVITPCYGYKFDSAMKSTSKALKRCANLPMQNQNQKILCDIK